MKKLVILCLFVILSAAPLTALAATVTIVHSCDNYGEVIPCG
jgi:hypothetical protein